MLKEEIDTLMGWGWDWDEREESILGKQLVFTSQPLEPWKGYKLRSLLQ